MSPKLMNRLFRKIMLKLKKTPGALFRVGWKPALGAAALGAAGAAGWALRGNKEVNDSTKVDKSTNKASTANVDLQKQ